MISSSLLVERLRLISCLAVSASLSSQFGTRLRLWWQPNRKRTNLLLVNSTLTPPLSSLSLLPFSISSRVHLNFAVISYIYSRRPAFRDRTGLIVPLTISSHLLCSFFFLHPLPVNCSGCITRLPATAIIGVRGCRCEADIVY